jgi:uncharacterized protein YjbI with pentapeptide repeats
LLPQKTEPTPFAAKAKDPGALRDAVVDAARVGAGLWISYLFALFYFAIAAGAVTHRDLLLESPVKLPFLNVELSLKAFFILGPLVFLIVHAYVLLHFVLSAGRIGAYHAELQAQISGDDARDRLRRQLPSNILVQSLAGPREAQTVTIRSLLWLIIWISLVAGPVALLILFQLQFLPYHSEWITWWQRIVVVLDLVLLWLLWPRIARGDAARLRLSDFKRLKVQGLLLVSILAILLVTTATFPGEWLEENPPPVPGWATLHELLFAGEVNYVTGRPQSLLSNVLVLPYFAGAEGKTAISSDGLLLRGRSLEGAVLAFAHLRKADFTGASLARANFTGADLREAKFECNWGIGGRPPFFPVGYKDKGIICAQLPAADFSFAQVQGASLVGARAPGASFGETQLQGANLDQAQLQGASLMQTHLQGASLNGTQLQGAWSFFVHLQGAFLYGAQLQGAWLHSAQLQGANLDQAQLQGAWLYEPRLEGAFAAVADARLEGASLRHTYVWRTNPPPNTNGAFVAAPEPGPKYSGLDCPRAECDWSEASYAALRSLIENSAPLVGRRDQALANRRDQALAQVATIGKPPYVADEASAKAWTDLAIESARSAGSYFNMLAKIFKEIGCAADGAPYVIGGLIPRLDGRFEHNPGQEAEVVAAFLDEAKCPGARGLSEENKAKLQAIHDRGVPAPPGPGATPR